VRPEEYNREKGAARFSEWISQLGFLFFYQFNWTGSDLTNCNWVVSSIVAHTYHTKKKPTCISGGLPVARTG